MEQELNYLSNKIEELEIEVSYYYREFSRTESEQKRTDINNIIELKAKELDILVNILNVITKY